MINTETPNHRITFDLSAQRIHGGNPRPETRNVKRFRGGLISKVCKRFSLNSRLENKKEEEDPEFAATVASLYSACLVTVTPPCWAHLPPVRNVLDVNAP